MLWKQIYEFKGHLYKTYVGSYEKIRLSPYSVSKINEAFSVFLTFIWGSLTLITAITLAYTLSVRGLEWLLAGIMHHGTVEV
jgi:hypothetical protein